MTRRIPGRSVVGLLPSICFCANSTARGGRTLPTGCRTLPRTAARRRAPWDKQDHVVQRIEPRNSSARLSRRSFRRATSTRFKPRFASARLTVHEADGRVETIVVNGREKLTLDNLPTPSARTNVFATCARYVSLKDPSGLPLPLWAGNMVSPGQGYADIFGSAFNKAGDNARAGVTEEKSGTSTDETSCRAEKLENGGWRLISEHSTENGKSTLTIVLDSKYLPVHLEVEGTGEVEGTRIEYSGSLDYTFQNLVCFTAADFTLDVPDNCWQQTLTYELVTERPWSEQADWGQYWLGKQIGGLVLAKAEHTIYREKRDPGAGAEFTDEFIRFSYQKPGAGSKESIEVMLRPLRGRQVEDSRTSAEQRVTSGDWVKRELTLADARAVAYYGALEGGPNDRADTMCVFLPDCWIDVMIQAPLTPQQILEAFRRVQ